MADLSLQDIGRIDAALYDWNQGDCFLDQVWFGQVGEFDGTYIPEFDAVPVKGLVVTTQTCDIVRSCADRPYLEFSPLIEVMPQSIRNIEQGNQPGYGYIPAIADRFFVADLDRTMTVPKALAESWNRTAGCRLDPERRRLSLALSRKRLRFAFPDDFNLIVVKDLQGHMRSKSGKNSDEGRAIDGLLEIRVKATPDWNALQVHLDFMLIKDHKKPAVFVRDGWDVHKPVWESKIRTNAQYNHFVMRYVTLLDITAEEYYDSDALDLTHLSVRAPRNPPLPQPRP